MLALAQQHVNNVVANEKNFGRAQHYLSVDGHVHMDSHLQEGGGGGGGGGGYQHPSQSKNEKWERNLAQPGRD